MPTFFHVCLEQELISLQALLTTLDSSVNELKSSLDSMRPAYQQALQVKYTFEAVKRSRCTTIHVQIIGLSQRESQPRQREQKQFGLPRRRTRSSGDPNGRRPRILPGRPRNPHQNDLQGTLEDIQGHALHSHTQDRAAPIRGLGQGPQRPRSPEAVSRGLQKLKGQRQHLDSHQLVEEGGHLRDRGHDREEGLDTEVANQEAQRQQQEQQPETGEFDG